MAIGLAIAHAGSVARQLGRLAWRLGRIDAAETDLRHGIEQDKAMGARPYVALGQCELADLLLESDEPSRINEAIALLDRAEATGRALGMQQVLGRTSVARRQTGSIRSIEGGAIGRNDDPVA
jgi:hypothetical protein